MRTLTATAALGLLLAPGFAFAMGCGDHDHAEPVKQVQSCALGAVLDKKSGRCVQQTS